MTELRLFDNTRLQSFDQCRRKFFFRHVCHIAPAGTAPPLAYGLAWHEAMDVVWAMISQGHTNDELVAQTALAAWADKWEEEKCPLSYDMTEEETARFRFRNETTAREMLENYVVKRRSFIENCEVLAIERPFAVPLHVEDSELFYVGRLDKVVRWENRVWAIEHKTTSSYKKDGYFRNDFSDSFSPNSQVDGYLHALHMLYGKDAKGVMIDAALVHGSVHDGFGFIPVDRRTEMLEDWLFDQTGKIADLEMELRSLDNPNQARLGFRKSTHECMGKYGACSYLDICKTVVDPERFLNDEPPIGFKREKWEPFKELGLEKIGVQPE